VSYAIWWSEGDKAEADARIREFTEAAYEHGETCDRCFASPCAMLRDMIDAVEREVKRIGDAAFARYVDASEKKYAHRDYWTRRT